VLKSFPLESVGGVRGTNSSRQCQYFWIAVDLRVLKLDRGMLRSERGKCVHGPCPCCHCTLSVLCMDILLNSFTEWDTEFVSPANSFILRNGNNWEADAEARLVFGFTTSVTNRFTTLYGWALLQFIKQDDSEKKSELRGPDFHNGYFRGWSHIYESSNFICAAVSYSNMRRHFVIHL